jgi:hypothetical protein
MMTSSGGRSHFVECRNRGRLQIQPRVKRHEIASGSRTKT